MGSSVEMTTWILVLRSWFEKSVEHLLTLWFYCLPAVSVSRLVLSSGWRLVSGPVKATTWPFYPSSPDLTLVGSPVSHCPV